MLQTSPVSTSAIFVHEATIIKKGLLCLLSDHDQKLCASAVEICLLEMLIAVEVQRIFHRCKAPVLTRMIVRFYLHRHGFVPIKKSLIISDNALIFL
jgi:hypothetical protein